MLQLAERLTEEDLLLDRHVLAADPDGIEAELGLAARRRSVSEDFEARGDHRTHRAVAPRVRGVVEPSRAHPSQLARTCEKRALHFIGVVEHRTSLLGPSPESRSADVALKRPSRKRMLRRKSCIAVNAVRPAQIRLCGRA